MRLGFTALRGSNPRSSALTSSFVRKVGLGGLLVQAWRVHCVSITITGPFSVPAMTCAAWASALPGNLPDHRKPMVGRSARSPVAGLRSRPRLVGAGAGPGTTRPKRASHDQRRSARSPATGRTGFS
jgi:hypothetical protein